MKYEKKGFRAAVFIFSLSGLVLIAQVRNQVSPPVTLVKIDKTVQVLPLLESLQLDVRQELESCYLAMASREDLSYLRKSGARFSVLERFAQGRRYFLFPAEGEKKLSFFLDRGKLYKIEPATILFSTDDHRPESFLPPDLARKPLPDQSILPYLKPAILTWQERVAGEARDPIIADIVFQVQESNLMAYVQTLQNFGTRFASTAACEAAGEYIYNYFSSLGLDRTSYQTFSFGSGYVSRNIIAEKRGRTYPDDWIILCGHYDSTSGSETRSYNAPGADDNASGTAAVMEAARVLASRDFDFSIIFVAFSAEEWGLYGSRALASAARQAGRRIVAVINLDMIAYADAMPEDLDLVVNNYSQWVAERLRNAASTYAGLSSRKIIDASFTYSDHAPFWDNGYAAVLGIEDVPIKNPFYHTTNDRIETLNFTFFRQAVGSAVALSGELAQPIRAGYPRTPAGLQAQVSVYSSLFNVLKNVRLTWEGQSDAIGFNIYRSSISHLDYVRVNAALIQGNSFVDRGIEPRSYYYYTVRAVSAGGLESNSSREIEIMPTTRFSSLFSALSAMNQSSRLLTFNPAWPDTAVWLLER